jgi:hypothetical protein
MTKSLKKIKHLRLTMLQYADEKFPKRQKSGRLTWPEWFKGDFDFINHLEVEALDGSRMLKEDMYRCNHIYNTYKVVYDTI